jgi:hypothetical protein
MLPAIYNPIVWSTGAVSSVERSLLFVKEMTFGVSLVTLREHG